MPRDLTTTESEVLSELLDSVGLYAILQGLKSLCAERAQDLYRTEPGLSRTWTNAAGAMDSASAHKSVIRVGGI